MPQTQRWAVYSTLQPRQGISDELRRTTKLRTLADMTEEEIRALERHFGCPVIRPKSCASKRKPAQKANKPLRAAARKPLRRVAKPPRRVAAHAKHRSRRK